FQEDGLGVGREDEPDELDEHGVLRLALHQKGQVAGRGRRVDAPGHGIREAVQLAVKVLPGTDDAVVVQVNRYHPYAGILFAGLDVIHVVDVVEPDGRRVFLDGLRHAGIAENAGSFEVFLRLAQVSGPGFGGARRVGTYIYVQVVRGKRGMDLIPFRQGAVDEYTPELLLLDALFQDGFQVRVLGARRRHHGIPRNVDDVTPAVDLLPVDIPRHQSDVHHARQRIGNALAGTAGGNVKAHMRMEFPELFAPHDHQGIKGKRAGYAECALQSLFRVPPRCVLRCATPQKDSPQHQTHHRFHSKTFHKRNPHTVVYF